MKIDKARQIATKTGDKGNSRNYSGELLSKADSVFSVLGTLDETSSFLGLAAHYLEASVLPQIQRELQRLASQVATNPTDPKQDSLIKITEADILRLEKTMDALLHDHPLDAAFVLPGSGLSLGSAFLDVARSVSRRAERELARLIKEKTRDDLWLGLAYLNRLSDLLFVLARSAANPKLEKSE